MTAPASRFAFGLQRVLDLRQQREESIAGRLGVAAGAADDARAAMDALAAVRDASNGDLARAHRTTRAVGEMHQAENLMASLEAQLDLAKEELASREAVVDEVRTELGEAMQARRVISRLRERREEEWRQAFTRSERTAMDALAVERHARQSDGEPITGGAEE